jgi:hypothetical protein
MLDPFGANLVRGVHSSVARQFRSKVGEETWALRCVFNTCSGFKSLRKYCGHHGASSKAMEGATSSEFPSKSRGRSA